MRRSQLAAMIISAMLQPTLSTVSNAGSGCGCSEGKCTRCNDDGILDALDQLAIQIQPKLKKGMSLPALSLNKSTDCDISSEPTCGAEPTCGVEPGCGIEVGCGVEVTCGVEANCGVEAECGVESYSSPPMPHAYSAPTPMPSTQRMSTDGIAPPSPLPIMPKPDAAVDPFQDEAASAPRPIPAQTISHGPSVQEEYKSSFDPQASNRYHRKLSDSPIQTVSAETLAPESNQTNQAEELGVSSRRVRRPMAEPIVTPHRAATTQQFAPATTHPKSNAASPAVIRASAIQESSGSNDSTPNYFANQAANPLR